MASSRSKKDRLKLTLPALAMVVAVIFCGATLSVLDSASPGRIDATATDRLQALCRDRNPCEVRLGDLVGGSWDRFYEFNTFVPQAEVSRVLGSNLVHTADLQRVLVLVKDGKIVRRQYAHTGEDQPLAKAIDFPGLAPGEHPGWVSFAPNGLFLVARCATQAGGSLFGEHGGLYTMLTPSTGGTTEAAPCEPVHAIIPHPHMR